MTDQVRVACGKCNDHGFTIEKVPSRRNLGVTIEAAVNCQQCELGARREKRDREYEAARRRKQIGPVKGTAQKTMATLRELSRNKVLGAPQDPDGRRRQLPPGDRE